jgi:hypothetical protein
MNKPIQIITAAILLSSLVYADRPQLLVAADQHDTIAQKVETVPWAKAAFIQLTDKIDYYVAKT